MSFNHFSNRTPPREGNVLLASAIIDWSTGTTGPTLVLSHLEAVCPLKYLVKLTVLTGKDTGGNVFIALKVNGTVAAMSHIRKHCAFEAPFFTENFSVESVVLRFPLNQDGYRNP